MRSLRRLLSRLHTVHCMLTLVLVLTPTQRQQHSHALGEQQKRERTRAEQARWPQEVLTFDSVASLTCVSEEGKEERVRQGECGAMRECVVELTGRRGAFNAACGI